MSFADTSRPLRLAIAGLGAIGLEIARRVDAGHVDGMVLTAIAARDHGKARERLSDFARPPALLPLSELAQAAEIIVECAPAAVFRDIARPALEQGRVFMPLSVGALLDNMDLVDLARRSRRPHHRAERRALGARRGQGRRAGHGAQREDGDPETARRASQAHRICNTARSTSRALPRQNCCFPVRRARQPGAFPPI